MAYYERKYRGNKYPLSSVETVAIVSTISDAYLDQYTGVVFPKVPNELEVAHSSKRLVIDGMKHNLGQPLVKVVLNEHISPGVSISDQVDSITRNKPKIRYVNGALIEKVFFTQVPIPATIIDKTKQYRDLAEKGNSNPKGLNDTDEATFKELDRALYTYYALEDKTDCDD